MSLLDTASLIVTPNGYKAGTLYSVIPNTTLGDLDVTRATTATRVNSSGLIESVASNVPRLDYTNGSCPSILVEPQRTNLFNYSEQFDNAYWTKVSSSIIANSIVSPDGLTSADKLTATGTSIPCVYKDSTLSGSYTISAYVKKGTSNYCWLYLHSISAIFNIDNGTIVSGSNATINSVGNGWYRVTLTATLSTTDIDCIGVSDGTSINGITGQYIYIWGAQLEAGSYATSYIPTTSASVTRNADVISKTGISSLIGQTEGTLFYDGYFGNNNSEVYLFLQKSGSTIVDDSMYIQKQFGNQIRFNSFLSSTSEVAITGGSFSIGDRIKIAVGYKNNDFVMYINGVQIGTDTSATPPTCANLHLATFAGDPTNEVYIANKSVNLTAFWKTRLTNTQMQTLTSL
jgi:hypothetical protein